jgi:hypothetical protein
MSNIGAHPTRMLRVIPSINTDIPYPTVISSGINTSTASDKLIDDTAKFISNNVKQGDIVYNITSFLAATVVAVNDEFTLILNADIFTSEGSDYFVYQASSQTGLGNQGCILYVAIDPSSNANINFVTIGGDDISNDKMQAGIFPVQVKKVIDSDSAIFALW